MFSTVSLDVLMIEADTEDFVLPVEMLEDTKLSIHSIQRVSCLSKANDIIANENISLIFLDLRVRNGTGKNPYTGLSGDVNEIPVIILARLTDKTVAQEAILLGAQDCLLQGEFDSSLLKKTILYSIACKRIAEAQQESNEQYGYLFTSNPVPMWMYDAEKLAFLDANEAAIKHYGFSLPEFLAMTVMDILAEGDMPPYTEEPDASLRETDLKVPVICTHVKKGGQRITVNVTSRPIRFGHRKAILDVCYDVSANMRLESELMAHQHLKEKQLSEAVIQAQEKERTEIGKILHDNVNQILSASKLYINAAMADKDNAENLLQRSTTLINDAINELRKISHVITDSGVRDLGLVGSLEDLVENIALVKDIKITFSVNHFREEHLDEEGKVAIFRIVQEQLNHILNHTDASAININLDSNGLEAIITVNNNGQRLNGNKSLPGVAIRNITTRAELMKGRVQVDVLPGNCSRLQVHIPMHTPYGIVSAGN